MKEFIEEILKKGFFGEEEQLKEARENFKKIINEKITDETTGGLLITNKEMVGFGSDSCVLAIIGISLETFIAEHKELPAKLIKEVIEQAVEKGLKERKEEKEIDLDDLIKKIKKHLED